MLIGLRSPFNRRPGGAAGRVNSWIGSERMRTLAGLVRRPRRGLSPCGMTLSGSRERQSERGVNKAYTARKKNLIFNTNEQVTFMRKE